jgi:HipA-like protein
MRRATVYLNQELVGALTETREGFMFRYDEAYQMRPDARPVSLTLPLTQSVFQASALFPFFDGLLPEGYNRAMYCRALHIDESDHFGLLLALAHTDTAGAVRVVEQPQPTDQRL